MKAYVQRGHGGPEVCSFEDLPEPVPGPGEVLLKVEAAGLNRLDLLQRQAPLVRGFALPHVAGMDVVGTVVAHGPDVHGATAVVYSDYSYELEQGGQRINQSGRVTEAEEVLRFAADPSSSPRVIFSLRSTG